MKTYSATRGQLLDMVSMVKRFYESSRKRRSGIPILATVLVSVRERRLHMTTTDLSCRAHCSMQLEEAAESDYEAICVEIVRLEKVLKAFRGDVSIRLDERQLMLKSGVHDVNILGVPEDEFPTGEPLVYPADATIEAPATQIRNLFSCIGRSISQEESRFQLNAAQLITDDGLFRMVSTDGHRLTLIEIKGSVWSQDPAASATECLVPYQFVLGFSRLPVKLFRTAKCTVQVFGGHILLKASHGPIDFQMQAKKSHGTFPDVERLVGYMRPFADGSPPEDTSVTANYPVPEQFHESVQTIRAMGSGYRWAHAVALGGEQPIGYKHPDCGTVASQVEKEENGDDLFGADAVGVSSEYLDHAFRIVTTFGEGIVILTEGPEKPIGIIPRTCGVSRCECLIMPIRLTDDDGWR